MKIRGVLILLYAGVADTVNNTIFANGMTEQSVPGRRSELAASLRQSLKIYLRTNLMILK